MQRTDTEMLDFLLSVMADDSANFEALEAAHRCGYTGREAIALAMGAQTFEPGQPLPPVGALDLIADECKRVREVEGYDADHDDKYDPGVLAAAGCAYALAVADELCPHSQGDGHFNEAPPTAWPFGPDWWKFDPRDPKRALVKAGQFIVAELDRELRKPTPMKPAEESPQEELPLSGNMLTDEARRSLAESCDNGADILAGGPTVTALGEICAVCNAGVDEPHKPDCPVSNAQAVADTLGADPAYFASPIPAPVKGSRVRVIRSAPEWEGWVPAMGKLVGNQYIVEDRVEAIRTHPATVLVGDWHIPASCCEIVP